MTQQD